MTSSRIFGARVRSDGGIVDGRGFPISQEPVGRAAFRPRVAFREYDYLVVWTSWAVQEQADGSVASSDSQIHARYVNNWGQMWGSDKLVATGGEDAVIAPSAAEFMVAWTDPGKVARVTPLRNGVPATPGGVAVAASGVFEDCRLASDGASYLLVAKHRPAVDSTDVSIRAIRLNGDGAVLASPLVLDASAGVSSPAVAFASGTYLVAWSRASDASVAHVRLNTAGAVLDAAPVLTASGESASVAHVAGSPAGFFVGRTTPSGARAGYWVMRIESSGLVRSDVRVQALPNGTPTATWGDGRLLAVSELGNGDGTMHVHGPFISATGGVNGSTPFRITGLPSTDHDPAVAFDGTNYLVAWMQWEPGWNARYTIYSARVSQTGTVLGTSIAVPPASFYGADSVAIASDGAGYLVVYSGEEGPGWRIYATRVSAGGEVLETTRVNDTFGSMPATAFGAGRYLVAWADIRNDANGVYGRFLGTDGAPLGPELAIAATTGSERPAAASNGAEFLVAWNAGTTARAARVGVSGQVLDTPALDLAPATTHHRPAVASDGSGWLVVSSGSANGLEDVYGARVSADGGVLDRPALKISRSELANARAPSPVFDGTQYVAAWVNVPFLVGAPPLGVYGARISTAGEVRDPGGVRLSDADMNGAVALAADGLGTTLVAYDVVDHVVDAESIKGVLVSGWSDTPGPLGPYPLSWSTTGSGTGTVRGTLPDGSAAAVTCTANGSCSGAIVRGTVVTLTPSPSSGSVFTGWSGACADTGACNVSMTSARTVVATFASTVPQPGATRTLVVATTSGGTVASDDGAIACGTSCTATHPAGTPVVLTAYPETDYLFSGWSGACGGTGTCLVDALYDQLVIARFEPTTWPVIVDVVGDGNGTVTSAAPAFSCARSQNSCSVPVANTRPATLVTLTATAAAVTGWSTPCTGTGACTVKADTVRRVVAGFEARERRLDVVMSGTGAGTVAASPLALTCAGRACSALVPRTAPATVVTLTAAPDGSSTFAGWSGSCSGTGPCAVTMDAARSVGARFEAATHRLTVDPTDLQGTVTDGSGLGLACSSDAGAVCSVDVPNTTPATVVVLTMTPNAGARFDGWLGACSGTGPCALGMTGPKTVAARFEATSFPLILDLWGNGQGTVTAGAPVGLACARAQNTCSADVANATPAMVVELTATAAEGSTFAGWTAPCSGTGTCLVTMDQLRRVAAQFVSP